ncbi:MAG TPA: DUF561 domain-containing protein, partial [Actinobacteria bacterium]|nr:DUF561 domain-containing protein [Actinomycetes bacterium]HEX21414.1 DUF561 domain-containing protein [Actinomycetota bacterium]
VSYAGLAGAVSNGGGLGIIASGMLTPDTLKEQIEIAKTLTDKPFGVNIMMLRDDVDDIFQTVLDNPVAVVTTGAGNPGKYINDLKDKGIKVATVVASIALAKRLERAGADAIIAEGMEAGGHIGELTTMCLVPSVSETVDIPVIAAGGIIDGRGVAAALMLGAKGVQMGTRFICSEEAEINIRVKERVVEARDRDTTVTGRCTGHPVRVIRNKLARQMEALDKANAPDELMKLGKNSLRRAMEEGDIDGGSLMCGQGAALVKKIQPAAEIILDVMKQTESIIRGSQSVVKD